MSRASVAATSRRPLSDDSSSSDEDLLEYRKRRSNNPQPATRAAPAPTHYDSSSSSDFDLMDYVRKRKAAAATAAAPAPPAAAAAAAAATEGKISEEEEEEEQEEPRKPASMPRPRTNAGDFGRTDASQEEEEEKAEARPRRPATVSRPPAAPGDYGVAAIAEPEHVVRPPVAAVARPPPAPGDYGQSSWELPAVEEEEDSKPAALPSNQTTGPSRKRRRPARQPVARPSTAAVDYGVASLAPPLTTPASQMPTPTGCFQMATYNVWTGVKEENHRDPQNLTPDIAGWPYPSERMQAVAGLLLSLHQEDNPLWLVGLQEVSFPLACRLYSILECYGYTLLNQVPFYGCGMAIYTGRNDVDEDKNALTLMDSGCVDFAVTRQGRAFLWARVRLPDCQHEMVFATCHMDSWIGNGDGDQGCDERKAQLQELDVFLQKQMDQHPAVQTVVIAGDLNYDDESKSKTKDDVLATVLPEYKDAWLTTRLDQHDTCYTYDGPRNVMRNNYLRRRLDRCLFKARPDTPLQMWAAATSLIGTETLPGLKWDQYSRQLKGYRKMETMPSDHFGFVAEMKYHDRDRAPTSNNSEEEEGGADGEETVDDAEDTVDPSC